MPDDVLFQAEAAVLGACLMDSREVIPRVQKLLPSSEFQGRAHRAIVTAMYALHEEGTVIDPLTLTARLEQLGTLKAVGGSDYIYGLQEAVPTAANVMHHAKLVKQDADSRRLVVYLTKSLEGLKQGSVNLREFAAEAQTFLLPLALEEDGRGFRWISKEDIEEFLKELERRASRVADGLLPGIATGYRQIDMATQGFRKGEFVVLGGVPASMKTYVVLNILINAAYGRVHSGLVSGEMYRQSLIERLLSAASLTPMSELARGSVTTEERERITKDGSRLESYIAIDDEAAPQLGDVIARCTELKAKEPRLQIIGVDYIQLIQNRLSGRRGDEEINEVCKQLKALALKLDVLLIAPAQANYKEVEARPDKRCQLRDFQGASGMVQYGDFVATIYNERQYTPDAQPILELDFQKTRRCSRFTAFLDWDTRSMAIYEKQKPKLREIA